MSRLSFVRRPRRVALLAGLAAAATVGSLVVAAPAIATTPSPGAAYLALGDSIPFGYVESSSTEPHNYLDATSLVGYPEDLASDLHIQVANASCPGETTNSYLKNGAPSNGCENSPDANGGSSNPGYRTGYLLHQSYASTQARYAKDFLHSHPNTGLVTLQIGANDGLLCQRTTADQCQSEQGPVINTAANNIDLILHQLRGIDNYKGQIVLVQYYSLDYADATKSFQSRAVNGALTQHAAKFHAMVAPVYTAFQNATTDFGGDPCAAGLLTPLSGGGCGIHPSAAGQTLITQTIETTLSSSS